MTEELQQSIEQVELDDFEPHFIDLARLLVEFHRDSLEIRSQGFFESISFDPPEVRELMNFLMWCGNGFNVIDRNEHVLALSVIIRRNASDIRSLIQDVRKYGATEELAYEVNYVNAQLAAADTLMGLISDG